MPSDEEALQSISHFHVIPQTTTGGREDILIFTSRTRIQKGEEN